MEETTGFSVHDQEASLVARFNGSRCDEARIEGKVEFGKQHHGPETDGGLTNEADWSSVPG